MYQTGYYYRFLGLAQMTAAVLLLIPATATIGAVIYFPIILNIFIITVAVHFTGTPIITGLMLLANIYLLCWDYDRLRHLFPGVSGPARASGPLGMLPTLGLTLAVMGGGLGGLWILRTRVLPFGIVPRFAIAAVAGLVYLLIARRAIRAVQ